MKRNVIVGQSGGPTSVINSSLAGVYRTAKDRGANKVYGMLHGIQGLLEGKYVDLSDYIQTELDAEVLKRTPSAFLGSCRFKLPGIHEDKAVYEKIFAILDELDIEAFIYIGGNDSMDTIKKLSDYAIVTGHPTKFIGCPKTIDNDLALTDHTPGFGSAAKYISSVMKELIRDGHVYDYKQVTVVEIIRDSLCLEYSKGLVTIVEVMGRNAGWLTGATALSKGEDCDGPDLIYLPEITFDVQDFKNRVAKLLEEKTSVIVAVSEGICTADGRYVCELGNDINFVDAFGHKQLSGTAAYLASFIAGELGCKTRAIEFSTLQRSASHLASRVDVLEATQVGGAAVKAADEGDSGQMVVLERLSDDPYQCGTAVRDVHKIANDERCVPREWITEDGCGLNEGYEKYARPLIMGELTPLMVNGLPRHFVIK